MYLVCSEPNKQSSLSIVYQNKPIQEFDDDFCKCLSSLIAYYYVFNISFDLNNEKILGFILESLSFTEQMHFDKTRSVSYLKTLADLKQND